ncbi:MAG: glycerophosphodiester phosphodiesterase [Gemmatimonadota bacterium]|nr:glycerophosphodiester phosphodiesterase [Gemmatimonadota bacterium]
MEGRRPLSIAHRGAHRSYPENSIPAILRALELGAQGVEIDVHATADGSLVVHHDPDLLGGRLIREMTAAQMRNTELLPGVAVPFLDEVLETVAGRAVLFIETKVEGVEFAILRAVRSSSADSAVHSFHHETILNLKATMPALRTGVLTSGSAHTALLALQRTGADDLWHEAPDINAQIVSDAHRLGKQVIAWTANEMAECRRLIHLGVDGICTDDLEMLSAVAR